MSASQILVVEDETLVAKAIQYELEDFGFHVSGIAASAREAVEKAEATRPDLVLMDVHLKGAGDGIEAARTIHSRYNIPVVYLSAFSDAQTLERAGDTAAYGYLLKPYDERELQSTITMALAKHRLERQQAELERVQRQSEERRRRAQKMEAVSRLAGGLADHLDRLIKVILGNTSLALAESPEETGSRERLERVEIAAQRAADLVQRLMMFSTFSGPLPILLEPVDLNHMLPACLNEIRTMIDPRMIVSFKPAADVWPVAAEEQLLGQALLELALNAQAAMPHGGKFTVELENVTLTEAHVAVHPQELTGDFVILHVADTGEGIPPQARAEMFDTFFTTQDTSQSYGLGLALVFAVVEQFHGWIEYAHHPERRGAQFNIYLPRAAATGARP